MGLQRASTLPIINKSFTVLSDHGSLQWMYSWKNAPLRVKRWLASLASFDFSVVYRPGPKNVVADALSRAPASSESVQVTVITENEPKKMEIKKFDIDKAKKFDLKTDFPAYRNWAIDITEDKEYGPLVKHLNKIKDLKEDKKAYERWKNKVHNIQNGKRSLNEKYSGR